MEYKALPTVSDVDADNRTVTGFAAIMGNVDDGGDITHLGAFSKTIQERGRRIRHLWQHDASQPPIAAIVGIQEVSAEKLPSELVSEYPEVQGGLKVTRKYFQTERADEVYQAIRGGVGMEMSFGFDIIKYDFTQVQGKTQGLVRNLRELRLWDTSDVNWGMNPLTLAGKIAPWLEGMKGELPEEEYEILSQLITATQGVLDPVLLKAGRVLSASNIQRLKDAIEALELILTAAEPQSEEMEPETPKLLADALTVQKLAQRLALATRSPIYSVR